MDQCSAYLVRQCALSLSTGTLYCCVSLWLRLNPYRSQHRAAGRAQSCFVPVTMYDTILVGKIRPVGKVNPGRRYAAALHGLLLPGPSPRFHCNDQARHKGEFDGNMWHLNPPSCILLHHLYGQHLIPHYYGSFRQRHKIPATASLKQASNKLPKGMLYSTAKP